MEEGRGPADRGKSSPAGVDGRPGPSGPRLNYGHSWWGITSPTIFLYLLLLLFVDKN